MCIQIDSLSKPSQYTVQCKLYIEIRYFRNADYELRLQYLRQSELIRSSIQYNKPSYNMI